MKMPTAKIVFSSHAIKDNFPIFKERGFHFTRMQIRDVIAVNNNTTFHLNQVDTSSLKELFGAVLDKFMKEELD